MSVNSKEISKSKISKKLNNTKNKGKLFSKKNQMLINLVSSENNDSNSLEKKFFSDNSINNEKKISSHLLEKEKEKANKNKKKTKNLNDNLNDNNDVKLLEKNTNKDNEEKEENNMIQINKEKEKENEKENKIEESNNENNNINDEIDNENKNENENNKDNLKPDDIMIDIQKDKSNLELIQEKNNILENKLKDLLLEVKEQETNMVNTKKECEKKLILLNSNIKKQSDINKKVINNISKLQKDLNTAYDKLVKYFSKNKNNFYNQNKAKIERQLKVKESQYNYNQKVTLLLMKEINQYNKKIKSNTLIDENIRQENPLINKKEEEYRFILNKLNKEIDKLKQDIQALKKIRNKHIMCSKLEHKLLNEIEFYKVEKQKKLDYIESLNKFKYFQNLRKRKVQIEREQFNNLSYNNVLSELKISSDMSKFENSFLKKEFENNNEITTIAPVKRIILKNLKSPLFVSKSTNNINIFQKAMEYEQSKIAAEKNNEKKISLKDKFYNSVSKSSLGLFPNKLFTDEEKSVIKNYQFIPQEKVNIYEKKYTTMLDQISKTEKKIKDLGKKNEQKLINMKCKLVTNEKKQKEQEKISFSNSLIIKQNNSKILKIKALIKERNKEEKKMDLEIKKQNLRYEQLKQIIEMSNNFENLTSIEDFDDVIINFDEENKKIIDVDVNNESGNDKNLENINDKGKNVDEENHKENE